MHRRRVARQLPVAALVLFALAAAVGYGRTEAAGQAAPVTWSQAGPSPCGVLSRPAWSPDGEQFAAVGVEWPRPRTPDRILRAICIADADGSHAEPIPATISTARWDFIGYPNPLVWVRPAYLLEGDDFQFFIVPVGEKKPRQIGFRVRGDIGSVNAAGNRFAVAADELAAGPIKVLRVPSGTLVGSIGGNRVSNVEPSLSPRGTQLVFVRNYADGSGTLGIWAARTDGSHLRQLVPTGGRPLWSPTGGKIAYLSNGLNILSLHGGRSTLLVSQHVTDLLAWSPNGKQIAFLEKRTLAVVQVATGKVRKLLNAGWPETIAWSPNSQELLVTTPQNKPRYCSSLWRVPANGGKPQLLTHC